MPSFRGRTSTFSSHAFHANPAFSYRYGGRLGSTWGYGRGFDRYRYNGFYPGAWGLGYYGLGSYGYPYWNSLAWSGLGGYAYVNPYYVTPSVGVDELTYDYSRPLPIPTAPAVVEGQPTTPPTEDRVSVLFDEARDYFRTGDYQKASATIDHAIALAPSDTVLHEFRAMALFAMRRYEDAAATLYAVLAVGPGWNWDTVRSLYGDPAYYTRQLRDLEEAYYRNPKNPALSLVLAYQYLVLGHVDAARGRLETVVALNPNDKVAAGLLKALPH